MVRTQIQLTPDQAATLKRLAADRGVSMAELVRQSVDDLIARSGAATQEQLRRRALSAIGILQGGPTDLSTRHDDYAAEAYEACER